MEHVCIVFAYIAGATWGVWHTDTDTKIFSTALPSYDFQFGIHLHCLMCRSTNTAMTFRASFFHLGYIHKRLVWILKYTGSSKQLFSRSTVYTFRWYDEMMVYMKNVPLRTRIFLFNWHCTDIIIVNCHCMFPYPFLTRSQHRRYT